MHKKYLYPLIALIIITAGSWIYLRSNNCKTIGCRIEAICKGNYVPTSDTINIINKNATIVFVEYERDGIAQHDFEYSKTIDTAFFIKTTEEFIRNDDEAGGYAATVRIYKALKTGNTTIDFYKNPTLYMRKENDTVSPEPVKLASYKFHIK